MNPNSKSDLRQRNSKPFIVRNTSQINKYEEGNIETKERKIFYPISDSHLLFILILMVTVFVAVIVIEKKLPHGIKITEEWKYSNRFIAERSRNFLVNLTQLGPRIAGSDTNEIQAVNLVVDEIKSIMNNANKIHKIELDVQKASGAYSLKFLDGFSVVYNNMQNVIVKLGSKNNSPYSLLINCHFDSVTDSPGASDDGAGCAIMIEILRVLSKSDRRFKHNIVFLFNGAEENFMPASHGFITQHKWAKEIKVFINLEACGAGGRELLFQAGPNHPWIMDIYSKVVPYPFASTLAQEIFQSGLVPGDTDYRIFRDFGNISGLDFAWSSNGYVYHTKFDTINYIPLGSLQRTGDNILALVKGIANAHQLSNVEKYRSGNLIFFDFLGAYVFRWTEFASNFVNLIAIALSFYCLKKNRDSCDKLHYYKTILNCVVGFLVSWIILVLVVLAIAILLNLLGRTMSWFARPVWIFFLYICPTILVPMVYIRIYSRNLRKEMWDSWKTFEIYYDAIQLIWTVILLLCVIFRIRSGFIPLLWVIFSTVGNYIQKRFFKNWRDWRWLSFYVLVLCLPFIQSFYLILSALYLFIPIMGRSGAGNNSEIIIAIMSGILFSLLTSYIAPLILLVKRPGKIVTVFLGVFLISMGILLLTPFGFPYSGDPQSPAPQRFMIANTKRTFHDESNNTLSSTGYWLIDLDINSPYTVNHLVPEMINAQSVVDDCKNYLLCGQPYYVPVLSFIWKTHWLPGPPPNIKTPTQMKITKRIKTPGREKITFKITGSDHIGIMFSPFNGISLLNWTILNEPPLSALNWKDNRKTYFVYFVNGRNPVPLQFTIDLETPKDHSGQVIDLAITSHIFHGEEKTSAGFKKLINKFPVWTAVTSWSATYESWIL